MGKLIKSKPISLYQWNEGAGEYELTCPRCSEEVFGATLKMIRKNFFKHYKAEPCKDIY